MKKNHGRRKLCKNDGVVKHSVAGIFVRLSCRPAMYYYGRGGNLPV